MALNPRWILPSALFVSLQSMPTPKKHPHLVPLGLHQNRDQVEESASDPEPSARPQTPKTWNSNEPRRSAESAVDALRFGLCVGLNLRNRLTASRLHEVTTSTDEMLRSHANELQSEIRSKENGFSCGLCLYRRIVS